MERRQFLKYSALGLGYLGVLASSPPLSRAMSLIDNHNYLEELIISGLKAVAIPTQYKWKGKTISYDFSASSLIGSILDDCHFNEIWRNDIRIDNVPSQDVRLFNDNYSSWRRLSILDNLAIFTKIFFQIEDQHKQLLPIISYLENNPALFTQADVDNYMLKYQVTSEFFEIITSDKIQAQLAKFTAIKRSSINETYGREINNDDSAYEYSHFGKNDQDNLLNDFIYSLNFFVNKIRPCQEAIKAALSNSAVATSFASSVFDFFRHKNREEFINLDNLLIQSDYYHNLRNLIGASFALNQFYNGGFYSTFPNTDSWTTPLKKHYSQHLKIVEASKAMMHSHKIPLDLKNEAEINSSVNTTHDKLGSFWEFRQHIVEPSKRKILAREILYDLIVDL